MLVNKNGWLVLSRWPKTKRPASLPDITGGFPCFYTPASFLKAGKTP